MRALVVPFAYNEGQKIIEPARRVRETLPGVRRAVPRAEIDLMIMDDGSTDGAVEAAVEGTDAEILRNETNQGVGSAMRRVIAEARRRGYDALVFMAGNNKDEPGEIPRLLTPIVEGRADIVQGSRYLPGGGVGNTPLHRQFATRFVHPFLFTVVTRRRMTDTTNGFRAIRLSIFDDPRINLDQSWLDRYELEPYILYKAVTLDYRIREVPVTKIYPPHDLGYTKMRPFTDWWSILRPLVYLRLGWKR